MSDLSEQILGAAIEVHKQLGPGLLESTYEHCLAHELSLKGIQIVRQKKQPIAYKGLELDEGYRLDLLVKNQIILELKVVDQLNDIHKAQLITYLKLSGCSLGYLLNFNVTKMKDGIKRIVHNHKE
ncbi:MAG: GxxExxY protein [Opitutales bacterium]|jgi:GxxExxY protein|nr:GxxExxY protein [Opitutales bacterium]MDP4645361.1 GxxExxY protein [Opitutales bacterium]MDP4694594.1 GxxExxY protein [Opitutales bacterium]MDP4777398.1 GxxExxY protein [Opitutales bacterium]MDP4883461.1 GxxExxY protein [Opitutales bacterium]